MGIYPIHDALWDGTGKVIFPPAAHWHVIMLCMRQSSGCRSRQSKRQPDGRTDDEKVLGNNEALLD